MDKPLLRSEQEVMDSIIETHNKFITLRPSLSSTKDWTDAIHKLQRILIMDSNIKRFPKYFTQDG